MAAERKRFYPTNIERWQNYSAYGDIVCHEASLEDDLFEGMNKHIGGYGSDALRDYVKLYNPYHKYHGSTEGTPNPHKSYGYLIQPKLSHNLRWYFNDL